MRHRYFLAGLLGIGACARNDVVEPTRTQQAPARRTLAVVEITFRNIGSPNMTSSALVASSVAELEALRAARTGDHASFDLTVPKGTTGSGNATIELAPLAVGAMTSNGTRYFGATYRVRNAQKTDSAAFDTPRHNLTFVAVSTASTISDTPVAVFTRQDGAPADPALTRQLLPSGLVVAGPGGGVVSLSPDVLQVLTEPEVAAINVPSDVSNTFPYGFMVHRAGSTTTRTLPPLPAPSQFDGVVSFAFRIPLQANPANDPSTITLMMLALDDSETRLTQSLEEQNAAGELASQQRATSLNASNLRLLPGGTVPGWPAAKTQLICSVRTAGFAGAATAFLVNVTGGFQFLAPSPYTGAGSFIPRSTALKAKFSQNVQGVGPTNFIVRGLQSGQAFRGATYSTAGTVVTTPAGSFFPGEEVEVVITSAISCPQPWVGRLRVQATPPSSGTLESRLEPQAGLGPRAAAIGDFNRDGFVDLALANSGANTVTIMRGNGTGTFTVLGTFSAGDSPESVVGADFNGDGILDLAVANANSDKVSILLGNGDGTFRSPFSFQVGDDPEDVVVGDLNADGNVDLVIVNDRSNNLSVLLGNGDGTFQPQHVIDTDRQPRAVGIGDFNADGILDLAVASNGNGAIEIFLGVGDGTFRSVLGPAPFDLGENPYFLALGDVNGDGRLDIVTAQNGARDISVLLGNGDGTFHGLSPFEAGGTPPSSVALGDMNGDGKLDVVLTDAQGSRSVISVLLGRGDGTFQSAVPFDSPSGVDPIFVAIGDFNRDGILDVFVGNNDTSSRLFGVLLGRR